MKRRAPQALFHCDAVQGFGKLELSLRAPGVDLLTVSAHKLHAPKGAGALFVRKGVRLRPVLHGGGQEEGRRAGTENVPQLCAFASRRRRQPPAGRKASPMCPGWAAMLREGAGRLDGVVMNSPKTPRLYLQSFSPGL